MKVATDVYMLGRKALVKSEVKRRWDGEMRLRWKGVCGSCGDDLEEF
jgi:hypothetical protein